MTNLMRLPSSGAIAINDAIDRMNTLTVFVSQSLREGLDYGTIPGCGDKPILFKPGAEKIATLFGLRIDLSRTDVVKDFVGQDFGGEPFFYFEYTATLRDRTAETVANCSGSCNSWEEKYRYRQAQRTCPSCGQPTILKSKQDASWFCWTKKGGCGAKFPGKDPKITEQSMGRVRNNQIFDQVNTIDKMAQKRAFVGAVILAANASNYFAVEHSVTEGVPVDSDYEPMQSIGDVEPLNRIQVEVMPDATGGNDALERIGKVISVTEHSWIDVKNICALRVREARSSELTTDEVSLLIRWLLTDYSVSQRYIQEDTGFALATKILATQPNITDESLVEMFLFNLDQMVHNSPVKAKAKANKFRGVSIE